ncbi:MAG TPA: hypothetical protein VHD35_13290 [Chitinophagaceae bacterium]|nr:hypothetical protein [Chitinophagaceae bacterium]
MKHTHIFPAIFCLIASGYSYANEGAIKKSIADSGIINHVLDGSTSEWPDSKFETDKETNIKYAIDNNSENLFLALTVPDIRTQMKMMRLGMNLFIDLKGKKKENRGIEFPVKREDGGFSGSRSDDQRNNQDENNGQQRRPDVKAIRSAMALNLLYIKLFGFTDGDPVQQGLQTVGSAQVAFAWDSSDVMHIEYEVPLKLLNENVAALNQKNISIGWKINGVDVPTSTGSSFGTSSFGNNSSGGSGRGGRNGGGFSRSGGSGENSSNFSQADREKMTEPQSFWTKYTFSISVDNKGS